MSDMIAYPFPLREGRPPVWVYLPEDLTAEEAQRLDAYLHALAGPEA